MHWSRIKGVGIRDPNEIAQGFDPAETGSQWRLARAGARIPIWRAREQRARERCWPKRACANSDPRPCPGGAWHLSRRKVFERIDDAPTHPMEDGSPRWKRAGAARMAAANAEASQIRRAACFERSTGRCLGSRWRRGSSPYPNGRGENRRRLDDGTLPSTRRDQSHREYRCLWKAGFGARSPARRRILRPDPGGTWRRCRSLLRPAGPFARRYRMGGWAEPYVQLSAYLHLIARMTGRKLCRTLRQGTHRGTAARRTGGECPFTTLTEITASRCRRPLRGVNSGGLR